MAVMAADGALGLGARFVARPFADVSPTDEGVSVFSVLDTRLRQGQPNFQRFVVTNQIEELSGIHEA